jgi:hypothetical protein
MNLWQVREYIVRPALAHIGMTDKADVQLVMGTGAAESGFVFIDQTAAGPGPAFGPWQMEAATHEDIWRWLALRAALASKVRERMILPMEGCAQMHGNWFYAAIMCRLHYLRFAAPLPAADDIGAMAAYWKTLYNTSHGAGTVEDFKRKAEGVFMMKD